MDSLDLNTRLPPRKRLLAGLRKDSSESESSLELAIPSISSELYDRLRKIIKSGSSSPEVIVEGVNSVAIDAAEAASAARAMAVEKAAAAAKAKAAAKTALELLDTITRSEGRRSRGPTRSKMRKRHVEVKHLYKKDGTLETDGELARRLHHAMNSSPRISRSSGKKSGSCRKLGTGDSLEGKLENNVLVFSGADFSEREKFDQYTEKQNDESKSFVGMKAKTKRKKLLLSDFNVRDLAAVDNSLTEGAVLDNGKSSNESEMKITSLWKSKKLKLSHWYSDNKPSRDLCSNPSMAEASAVV